MEKLRERKELRSGKALAQRERSSSQDYGDASVQTTQALDSPMRSFSADTQSLEELLGHLSGGATSLKQQRKVCAMRASPRTAAAEGDLGSNPFESDWTMDIDGRLQQWLQDELEMRLAGLRKQLKVELADQVSQDLDRRIEAILANRQRQPAHVSEDPAVEKVRVVDGVVEGLDEELRSELFNVGDRLQSAVGELRGAISQLEQDMHDELQQVSAALSPGRCPQPAKCESQERPTVSPPLSGRKLAPWSQKGVADYLPSSQRLTVADEVLKEEPLSSRSPQAHPEVDNHIRTKLGVFEEPPPKPDGTKAPSPRSHLSGGNSAMEVAASPRSQRPLLESEVASARSSAASSYNIAGFLQRTRQGWMMKRLNSEQRGRLESDVSLGKEGFSMAAPGPSAVPCTRL
jgi:hypothetical protein